MTDLEIKNYLKENNNVIKSQDCITKILNTSHQIINKYYDFKDKTMTIITPDNLFIFKLTLE